MFFLSKFINIPVFIVSLLVGLCIIYFSMNDEMHKVYVFPSPDNIHLIQYKDNANMCFQFKEQEVVCPKDERKITKYNPQY
jgi:hypothetical protein